MYKDFCRIKHVASLTLVMVVVSLCVASSAWADAVQAGCNSSFCSWGYNYVFPDRIVYTPQSNFYSASTNSNTNTGYVYLGFGGPNGGPNCVSFATEGYYAYHPWQFGCASSSNTAFTQYASGNSSYLYFQAAYS